MRTLTLLLLFFAPLSILAQELYAVNWNLENGLPCNETYRVMQDRKGFIWICTDHGVVRYDGQSFELFSTLDGLTNNTVFTIYEDYKGRLWFLGMSRDFCYWDGEKIVAHPANRQIKDVIKSHEGPPNIVVDSNDVVYFTTEGEIGYYSVGLTDTIIHFTSINEQNATVLVLNTQESLLIKVPRIYELEEWSGPRKKRKHPLKKFPVMQYVTREYQSNKQRDIFFNRDTIYVYDEFANLTKKFSFEQKKEVLRTVYMDNKEQLWVATSQRFLFYGKAPFSKEPKTFFLNADIASIYEDREGNYWVSTLDQGIFFIPNWEVLHFFKGEGVTEKIMEKDGQILTLNLHRVWQLKENYPFDQLPNDVGIVGVDLFDIQKWGDNILLSNGVVLELEKDELTSLGTIDTVGFVGKSLYIDEEEKYALIGTSTRLIYVANDTCQTLFEGYWINAIEKVAKDKWLLGTISGLYLYDKSKNELLDLGELNPLFAARVLALTYFQDHLLVGTKGQGVLLVDPKTYKVINQWTHLNDISSAFIHCIEVENDSIIWVGTNQGANRLTVVKGNIQQSIECNRQNYLPSNGVNDILIRDNVVWFATDNGLAHIPKNIFHASGVNIEIPMYLKAVHINGSPVDLQETYDLTHSQRNIVIDFFALSYNVSNSILYRYQLYEQNETIENQKWVYTRVPKINCNNLAPDEYTLIIEVKTKAGKWQKKGLKVVFNIAPHFTSTWSFFFLIIGGVALSCVFYVRYALSKKSIEKELLEAEQKALRSQLKPHFLFNAINSVVYFLYKNEKKQALKFLQKFAKLMRSTLENTQHALILLEQDIDHLQLYLDMERERLSSGSSYLHDFYIEIPENLNLHEWEIPPMLIQPLVENAIIHGLAPKEGDRKLRIILKEEAGNLIIKVEDNGIGRTAAKEIKKQFFIKKTSQGLNLLNQRIETIHKSLNLQLKITVEDVIDDPGCSTRFVLNMPSGLKRRNIKS